MLSPERILQAGLGFRDSQLLLSALELGLFTELGKGPRTAHQLHRALGLSAQATAPWLDRLVELNFLERDGAGDGAIYLNSREAAHFLDRKSAAYVGVELEGLGEQVYAQWKSLIRTLQDGEPGA